MFVADKMVLMGNHRDAWVFGGIDPSSGTACLMEIAKAFGVKYSKGKTVCTRVINKIGHTANSGILTAKGLSTLQSSSMANILTGSETMAVRPYIFIYLNESVVLVFLVLKLYICYIFSFALCIFSG